MKTDISIKNITQAAIRRSAMETGKASMGLIRSVNTIMNLRSNLSEEY